jgi:hypothetical protein
MAKIKMVLAVFVIVGFFISANLAKAAPTPKCGFNGDYSFFFWDPDAPVSGVGFVGVKLDPKTKCRSGVVLPGGILNCNIINGGIFEDFIEDGFVFLESDGEGTMEIETNSSRGICGLGVNALELDISVVLGGKSVLFNSDGEEFAGSGLIPQAGYVATLTGRADKCFPGQISGCYDARFWTSDVALVGDCTICVNGAGAVTGGNCRCHTGSSSPLNETAPTSSFEYLSQIEGGGYTLGENCQSSTGYLWFVTSSDEICGLSSFLALDFAVAQQGKEIIGACDTNRFILNNESEFNAGFVSCAFEGWLQ